MQIRKHCLLLPFAITFSFIACEEAVQTPKPRGYPRVVYPEKKYQPFAEPYCGFSFDYPTYALIQRDTAFFDKKPAHPCWFNIYVPEFNCRVHCSYVPIDRGNPAEKLKADAFRMTDWHNKKATFIEEKPFLVPEQDMKGIFFEVDGPVASRYQFFVTDAAEQRHFFRGALYFDAQVQPDSLAPVYDFMRKDLERMLETFHWK